MRTDEPRQGRNAATVVCSAFAVVPLGIFLFWLLFARMRREGWMHPCLHVGDWFVKVGALLSMAYQVLARKHRPQRFEDVVGQDHIKRSLANAIQMNRVHHAILFCGPRGTGKTTLARIFAKCLNCANGPEHAI